MSNGKVWYQFKAQPKTSDVLVKNGKEQIFKSSSLVALLSASIIVLFLLPIMTDFSSISTITSVNLHRCPPIKLYSHRSRIRFAFSHVGIFIPRRKHNSLIMEDNITHSQPEKKNARNKIKKKQENFGKMESLKLLNVHSSIRLK